MPGFIVRVVLHKARDPEDYQKLHDDMEKKSYFRTIIGGDGQRYKLPSATYRARGDSWTVTQIRDEVSTITKATGFSYAVLVTEAVQSAWIGLEKVDAG